MMVVVVVDGWMVLVNRCVGSSRWIDGGGSG